ncbi:hypothetical protein GINT2_002210 [Glugoides intestinalis]
MLTEVTELEKKLLEITQYYKNDPEKIKITEMITAIKLFNPAESLQANLSRSKIPSLLINFLELKGSNAHLSVLKLIYMCIINDLYSLDHVIVLVNRLSKHSWLLQHKFKIIQMCFYFVRFKLPFDECFKLLSLILESFVVEDSTVDFISRPIVCQIVEKILENCLNHSDLVFNQHTENLERLFLFIYDNIVYKRQYFFAYLLPVIIKFPGIQACRSLDSFLNFQFTEISFTVLTAVATEEKAPIFESILEIEKSFSTISLELLYEKFHIVFEKDKRCPLLMKFISCLLSVRGKDATLPVTLDNILIQSLDSTDFFSKDSERFISLFADIIRDIKIHVEFVHKVFEKVNRGSSTGFNSLVDTLYANCLYHCVRNDLRISFEIGITSGYNGKIKHMNDYLFDMKNYVGPCWKYFFMNNLGFETARLHELSSKELEAFIDEIPVGQNLTMKVFEKCLKSFISTEKGKVELQLLEKLLLKAGDCQELFEIISKYYKINNNSSADPLPLQMLLRYLRQHFTVGLPESFGVNDQEKEYISTVQGLYAFLNDILSTIFLDDCWKDIFDLLSFFPGFIGKKLEIIFQIKNTFINELSQKHLEALLDCIAHLFTDLERSHSSTYNSIDSNLSSIQQSCIHDCSSMIPSSYNSEILCAFKTVIQVCGVKTPVWRKGLTYASNMVKDENLSEMDVEISFFCLEMLFDVFKDNYYFLTDSELVFFNTILFETIYKLKDKQILRKAFELLSQFLITFTIRYGLEDMIDFLTLNICEKDAEIALESFECLKLISAKIKKTTPDIEIGEEAQQKTVLVNKRRKKRGKTGGLDFDMLIKTVPELAPAFMSEILEKKAFGKNQKDIIVKSFKKILAKCDPLKNEILTQVFLEIPSFKFDSKEISALSEYLKKYIEMPDPYRTLAIDCFIKTCGSSKQFSFCLRILSSWLSEEAKEASLSLIKKIKETLTGEESTKVTGLNNFLDYSIQFSKSEDFLEPVLNLITKCECEFDLQTMLKLLSFTETFIDGQLEIKHSAAREYTIINYVSSLSELIKAVKGEFPAAKPNFVRILIQIIRKKAFYMKLKLECFEILFECYSFSQEALKSEIQRVLKSLIERYRSEGIGISTYSLIETQFILRHLIETRNVKLINSLKESLADVLAVKDDVLIESVRILFKILFKEENNECNEQQLVEGVSE